MWSRIVSPFALGLTLIALVPRPAHAAIGTLDVVPAATLLVPWFAEDVDDPTSGTQTIVAVSSTTSRATLLKVTLWTDAGIATFAFHIYLTGFDTQVFAVRDLFEGELPVTAPLNFDTADFVSPRGPRSLDASFSGCSAADFGSATSSDIPADVLTRITHQHRGEPEPVSGRCSGTAYGDKYAHGYLTIDVVNGCSPLMPSDPGYFVAGGGGVASNDNVILGEVRYIDSQQNFAWGDVAVHLEADASNAETGVPGQYTFYGRLVGWTAVDNREPLATRWSVPYPSIAGAGIHIWQDPKVIVQPWSCGAAPPVTPSGQWVAFDMAENAWDISALVPRHATSRQFSLGQDLTLPARAGWLAIEFSGDVAGGGAPENPTATQGFVSVITALDVCGSQGRFSGGFHAVALDSATAAQHITLPAPVVQP